METVIRFLRFYSDDKVIDSLCKLYGDEKIIQKIDEERALRELMRKMGEERAVEELMRTIGEERLRQIVEQLLPKKSDNNDFTKDPSFGIWKEVSKSDEELLNELGGNWENFPLEDA
ncbi:MAG: hypothetical protein ACE5PV_27760, partial [Candidatus Poribacteria bacterium]